MLKDLSARDIDRLAQQREAEKQKKTGMGEERGIQGYTQSRAGRVEQSVRGGARACRL